MRKACKFFIAVWMIGIMFAFLLLRGDGLVHMGDLLNLQVKMIHLPGKVLLAVDKIHPVPKLVKQIEYEMTRFSYKIVQWEFKTYEALTILVRRAKPIFTATYVF
jgi:hypothetical protein